MERDIDTRYQNEGPLTAEFRPAALDLVLQRFQTGDGARDGVLRTPQVQVHHFQEFTGLRADAGDETDHLVVGQPDLRGTDRGHPVVAAALRITRDQLVHGRTTLEDHLEDGLERKYPGHGGQRVVFTDRMPGQQ